MMAESKKFPTISRGNFINGLLELIGFFPEPKRWAQMVLMYSCSLVAGRIDFHGNKIESHFFVVILAIMSKDIPK